MKGEYIGAGDSVKKKEKSTCYGGEKGDVRTI